MYTECSRCAHPSHKGVCTKTMARGIRCACQFRAQMDLGHRTAVVSVDYSAMERKFLVAIKEGRHAWGASPTGRSLHPAHFQY